VERFKVELPKWLCHYLETGQIVCCATCTHDDPGSNLCGIFEKEVPADFVSSLDECPMWADEVPF